MNTQQTMIEFPTLQSKDKTMLVGFYPIQDCPDHTLKVLSWKGIDTISYKCMTKLVNWGTLPKPAQGHFTDAL